MPDGGARKTMTDSALIALIESEESQCIGTASGELSDQRTKAMEYYYSRPYGNEIEGRSQVVTSEVLDAIEAIMPALMQIFSSADDAVRFEPQHGPQDEAAAAQATDYANYVFQRQNNGFLVLYCFFKDALLQKNGFVKVYGEKYSDTGRESYEGLSQDEFMVLAQNDELELLEYSLAAEDLVDAVFRRTGKRAKVCVEPVPPEEVLISRDTPNELSKARFVEHRRKVSISRLREMGFDVEDDISDETGAEHEPERIARQEKDDSGSIGTDDSVDPATREVWVSEAYLRVDYDGDGIAEFRKVIKVGTTLLDNVEHDGCDIVTATPILMPHKIYGLSIADLVMQIQEIKSAVTRNLLDNFYFINNGRYEILDGMVNMADMLTNRPGGVVRSKVLGGVKRIDTPALGAPAYQMLEYFDLVKQNRIGVTNFPQATDPDALNKTAHYAEIFKNAAMERIELIARILAETGVKEVFWKIIQKAAQIAVKPLMVRLRDQWVTVDPRQWKDKFDMTVTVGLGTGSQQTRVAGAQTILQTQLMAMQAGMGGRVVTEQNVYNAAEALSNTVFPKKGGAFFTDPSKLPPAKPQIDPELQAKVQKDMATIEHRTKQLQEKAAKDAQDIQTERAALQADFQKHREKLMADQAGNQGGLQKQTDDLARREMELAAREAEQKRAEEHAKKMLALERNLAEAALQKQRGAMKQKAGPHIAEASLSVDAIAQESAEEAESARVAQEERQRRDEERAALENVAAVNRDTLRQGEQVFAGIVAAQQQILAMMQDMRAMHDEMKREPEEDDNPVVAISVTERDKAGDMRAVTLTRQDRSAVKVRVDMNKDKA